MAGVVPWEMAESGAVSVAIQPAGALIPGDGKTTMSLSGVPYISPQDDETGKAASAAADGLEYYAAENVQPSEVQGVTFDPTAGLAYACFELAAEQQSPMTVGLAWYSLPSEMDSYYIGIGDRSHEIWHWYLGPDDGVLTFDPDSWAGAGSAGDTLLVCVLLERGLPADFWQLKSGVGEVRGTGLVYEDATRYIDNTRDASAAKSSSTLPTEVDLRPYAPPINNQGSMGSCTAFAVADSAYNIMLSQLYANYQWNVSDSDFRASPMWCYVKSGISPYGSWNPVCGSAVGRYMSQPFSLLAGTGSAIETTVPYYATENCSTSFPAPALDEAAVLRIDSWAALAKTAIVDAIKAQLATYHRPVPIAMYGLENAFLYYSGGVYHYGGTSGANAGHAMCIVGYDDELQAFDVRNSWGPYWGLSGYWWCGYDAAQDLADLNRFSAYYMVASYNAATVEYFFDETPPPPAEYDEVEPNDEPAAATALPGFDFADFSACFDTGDAVDYFTFEHTSSLNTTVTVYYSPAQLAPVVRLYDDQGTLLMNATGGNGQLQLSGVWSTSGTAVVEVLNPQGSEGAYAVSGSASSPPAPPAGLTASDGSNVDGVTVSWNPVAAADSYTVQRALSADGPYTEIGAAFGTSVVDYDAELWQEYWYRVLAVNEDGISLPSLTDRGYRGIPAPAGVAASDGEYSDHIEICWDSDTPGTQYTVLRSVSPSGRWLSLGEFAAGPVADTDIVAGVVYYYAVCCAHDGLQGPPSAPDTGYVSITGAEAVPAVHVEDNAAMLVDGGEAMLHPDESAVITVK